MNVQNIGMVLKSAPGYPCGVRDYALKLVRHPALSSVSLHDLPVRGKARCPRHHFLKLFAVRRQVAREARRLSRHDLIHAQYVHIAWNGLRPYEDLYQLFVRKSVAPLAVTIHEHAWLGNGDGVDAPITLLDRAFTYLAGGRRGPATPLEVLCAHRGIHVHHRWQKSCLVDRGVPDALIRVRPIPMVVNQVTSKTRNEFLARFGLNKKRLLSIPGFISVRKCCERAVEALPFLPDDTVLCMLGDYYGGAAIPYFRNIQSLAERLGVLDRVMMTGYLEYPDLCAGLAASSVVLAPYDRITSSASISEAIGVGTPVIAANLPTFAELAEDGAGVQLADVIHPERFADAINELLDHSQLSSRLSRMNFDYAGTHSVDHFVEWLLSWYKEMLHRNPYTYGVRRPCLRFGVR